MVLNGYPKRLWWGQYHSARLSRVGLQPPVPAWGKGEFLPQVCKGLFFPVLKQKGKARS